MFRLDGKTALVTGASQGIGEAVARRLAGQGARVIVAARGLARLEEVAAAIRAGGGEALPLPLDLSRPAAVGEQLAALPEDWKAIDVVVNNAGITRDALFARMSLEQWEEVLRVNLTGAYAVTRELVRGMMRRRWGRIVFVSSVVGLMGNAGQANYAASKAGLIGLAKSLAHELGGRNVTANVVAPGFVETAMTGDLDEKTRQKLSEAILLRRFGAVDDVAAAVVYLASEEAGYVTGEVLNVSGGMYV
ncbi:MAG TPA: 3-oxoacyl-[acyl-carrier-protein] reductase [Thermoanaerobaculia bacterium]|jgi:3-oxoacyl-[acyl-carrier protein] reductase